METDSSLQRDVLAELAWEPAVNASEIGVAVSGGIVTLSGHVKGFAEKIAAERAVLRVKGVHGVAQELRVVLPETHERTDEDIALSIINLLRWHDGIPLDAIKVTVEQGHVTLSGEVNWQYQRELAARDAHHVKGVLGVRNLVTLRPATAPHDVEARIAAALQRSAELEAAGIAVREENGTVTLSGQARTPAERAAAEIAAWSAPGVREVRNEITVAGVAAAGS